MSRPARVRVFGKFEYISKLQEATVTIYRTGDPLIEVRPLRRHRSYALPLSKVAEIIVHSVMRAEVREKQIAKKKKRFAKRGLL